MNEYTPETGDAELKVLELARARRKSCITAESRTRTEAIDDVKFSAGEQWPEAVRNFRNADPTAIRPCLVINKTGQYVRQVVNDSRQNSPNIHVFPVGDGSDKEVAEIMNGLIRDIEQRTDADISYDTAIESSARAGEGYWRLVSRYIEDQPKLDSKKAFEQELAFQRIRNFATVHMDPSALCPAGSDSQYCFIDSWMEEEEFEAEYGSEKMAGLDTLGTGENEPVWMQDGKVLVAEYYSIEEDQKRTLALLKSGSQVILEEQAEPVAEKLIVAKRKVTLSRCVWRKITGNTVLEKTIWPCRYIPVFRVIGEEFEIEGQTIYQGLIRPMKDSQRMYNYWVSAATEKGALETKSPYIGAEGQFTGHERQWKNANKVPYAYLEYKMVELEGNLAPPPARTTASFAGAADVQMAQLSANDMNSISGIYKAGLGDESNEKSGRALLAKQREGDTSTFHYIDNLARAQRHCGRVLVEVLPKYLTGERIVRIVGEDGNDKMTTINGTQEDPETKAISRINDITIGRYDVKVNIGPSYNTRRQESADSMMGFIQAVPSAGQAIMDLFAQAMDWPGADAIAARLKKIMPPELTADDEEGQTFTPAMVRQMIQKAMQEMQAQFESSLEEREVAVKEYEAMTERLDKIENSATSDDDLRDKVATMLAEFIQQRDELGQ